MKPGPELDALVAEKVMGVEVVFGKPSGTVICSGVWNNIELCDDGYMMCKHPTYNGYMEVNFGRNQYSTDISAAMEIPEKLNWKDFYLSRHTNNRTKRKKWWSCSNYEEEPYNEHYEEPQDAVDAIGETAPHAICLAALKAKGVEIEQK